MAPSRLELTRHFLKTAPRTEKYDQPLLQLGPSRLPEPFDAQSSHCALFLAARHTIARFTAALDKEARTVVLPAKAGLIFPCIASAPAAAVVLALLTGPPNTPAASIPQLPKCRVTRLHARAHCGQYKIGQVAIATSISSPNNCLIVRVAWREISAIFNGCGFILQLRTFANGARNRLATSGNGR